MSLRHPALVLALLLASLLLPTASAESKEDVALRFAAEDGLDAVQPGCTDFDYEDNPCHAIATMMNGLDSPKIDVLILVPVGPYAERDIRIMRQSTEMWADGVDFLAADMGLGWLADGVEFHIAVEMVNTGESEFTTYPIVDPEIVVIASNPVGGIGIGIDPVDFAGQIFGEGAGQGPCHGVANPFDLELWQALPGFDSHHGGRSGTYVEDCGGSGGNICFSVNAAVDPVVPQDLVDFELYDLVSHETGHCLTLGHVGDGAEGSWPSVPTNDIMAYSSDPPGVSKCVSTLNVEGLAVAMSRYLDVNGDGVVNSDDYVHPNDARGHDDDVRPFQVQHPDNHYYASPTRKAIDCPQPDIGLVPLVEVVNFTPQAPLRPELSIKSKAQLQGASLLGGLVNFQGTLANAAGGRVELSVLAAPDGTVNGTEPPGYANLTLGLANVTAHVRDDGTWTADLDLSGVADGKAVVIAARWLDDAGALIDADRVMVVMDTQADGQAQDVQDAPAPALALLAIALLAVAVLRRKAR